MPKPSKIKAKVVVLKVSSEAARFRPEKAHGIRSGAEPETLKIKSFLEYEPPSLPKQPATLLQPIDEIIATRFRVAKADADLPPVPIFYDSRRRIWLLINDYAITYEGHKLIAPAGYAFDLSSVPRALWWLIAPNELSIVAPLFHDLLYEYRGHLEPKCVQPYRTYTRREADDLFMFLMEKEGIAAWRRLAAYSAVRALGGVAWAR